VGVRDYERENDYGRRSRTYYRDDRDYDDRGYDDDRDNGRPRVWKRRDQQEEAKKEPLSKREPVRIAGAVATLVSTGALVILGVEVTAEQQTQIRELILLAIPVIVPMIASFEVARSKVDSPATVERKMKEERQR
jgi:hypothetical protein